jgi:glutathione synthase/RimK-type ligase-like ATP-grasp enzyme
MILLWGLLEDDPMGMAHAALRKAGADFVFLDHRKIFESQVDYAFSPGAGGRCTVTQGETTIDLGRVGAAYVRGADLRDYPEMRDRAPDDPFAAGAAAFEFQLTACLDASDAVVINRSEASATNASKPFQLSVIREAGLGVPETFISNDAEAVRGFLARNPDSIYKSISGVRSIVRRVSAAHLDFLDDVGWCPSLFQRVVPGTNYRAHVLGGDVFAVRIESGQLDYRYGESTVVAAELPPEVAQKCVRLTSALGLHFSGIDLMRTPDDEWFCFEVNPSPAYSFFEHASGQPLSAALARFMIEADRRRGSP